MALATKYRLTVTAALLKFIVVNCPGFNSSVPDEMLFVQEALVQLHS